MKELLKKGRKEAKPASWRGGSKAEKGNRFSRSRSGTLEGYEVEKTPVEVRGNQNAGP